MRIFRDVARRKDFAFTAELFLKPDTDRAALAVQANVLRGHVDGVVLTDNQAGRLHLSPVAAAGLVLAEGLDPIVQLGCRNRNRIALIADLLGAAAVGASSVLLVRGQRVPEGFKPRPKAVLDVEPGELIAIASRFKDEDGLVPVPDLYVGSDFTLHKPARGWEPAKLLRKSAHGAQFVLSNLCLNTEIVRRYMAHVVAAGVPRELSIHVGVPIPGSADDARWLRDARPNNLVPNAVIERLERAPDPEQEGIVIAAELVAELKRIPGVRGAHLVATRDLAAIPAVIDAAR